MSALWVVFLSTIAWTIEMTSASLPRAIALELSPSALGSSFAKYQNILVRVSGVEYVLASDA